MHMPEFKTVKGIVIGRAEKNSQMTKEKWTKLIKNKPELPITGPLATITSSELKRITFISGVDIFIV